MLQKRSQDSVPPEKDSPLSRRSRRIQSHMLNVFLLNSTRALKEIIPAKTFVDQSSFHQMHILGGAS